MTILADQCINRDVIEALREKGFKIISASEVNLNTASDSRIFSYILENNHILLTFDKDFGNVLRFDIENSAGVIIVYIDDMEKGEIIKNTLHLFEEFNSEKLKGNLFIIEKTRIRIWPK